MENQDPSMTDKTPEQAPVKRGRGRPMKYNEKVVRITVALPESLVKKLDERYKNRSGAIKEAVEAYLDQEQDTL